MPVADLLVKQLTPEHFQRLETIANFPVNLHLVFGEPLEVLTAEKEKDFKELKVILLTLEISVFVAQNGVFQAIGKNKNQNLKGEEYNSYLILKISCAKIKNAKVALFVIFQSNLRKRLVFVSTNLIFNLCLILGY
jgi:hypothetical protein